MSRDEFEVLCDETNKLFSVEEIARHINEQRTSSNTAIGFSFYNADNDLTFSIYQNNSDSVVQYYLCSEKIEVSEIADKIGLKRRDKENRYGGSKIHLNFYGKGVSNPSYELFDDNMMNEFLKDMEAEITKHINSIEKILEN